MEAYPVISNGPFTDILLKERNAYINGYIQAEKDLALTWEDIDKIMQIEGYLNRYTKIPLEGRITFCSAVLRRFNESKQSK